MAVEERPIAHTSVDRQELTVEKRAVGRGSGVIQLWFRLASSADVPVIVRIADDLPDGVGTSEVGFHPGYAGKDWTCLDGRLWFTATIGPGEDLETVYAVRGVDRQTARTLVESPSIEAVQQLE